MPLLKTSTWISHTYHRMCLLSWLITNYLFKHQTMLTRTESLPGGSDLVSLFFNSQTFLPIRQWIIAIEYSKKWIRRIGIDWEESLETMLWTCVAFLFLGNRCFNIEAFGLAKVWNALLFVIENWTESSKRKVVSQVVRPGKSLY